jgi:hypothetical protein
LKIWDDGTTMWRWSPEIWGDGNYNVEIHIAMETTIWIVNEVNYL